MRNTNVGTETQMSGRRPHFLEFVFRMNCAQFLPLLAKFFVELFKAIVACCKKSKLEPDDAGVETETK